MSDSSENHINRRRFLKRAGLGALGLSMSSYAFGLRSDSQEDLPNIVLFLSDDHAKRDAGCYGNEVINTPNVDRLASEGMRFDEAYSITPTCVPSRTSIFTGLGPHRHGAHENHGRIDQGIKTLPQYLSTLGYRVMLAGKTHVKPLDAYPFELIDTEGDWNSVIVKDGSEVEQFLSSDAAKKEPFCLVIATNNPHVPWPRDSEYNSEDVKLHPYHLDTPDTREAMANYYSDVTNMDREVGRTLDLLEENGLSENTAFIYTSDHGPQFPHGKWELYDYGINVPFIIRWPGKVSAGSQSRAMVSLVDLLPTIIEMAGGTSPEDIDGESILDVTTGRADAHREVIYATHTRDLNMNYFPCCAIRNDRYKYIWNLAPERAFTNHITNSNNFEKNGGEDLWNSWLERANNDKEAKEKVRQFQHRPEEELYDLQNDPHELDNLAEEPGMNRVKERLRRQLREWMNRQGDEWLDMD